MTLTTEFEHSATNEHTTNGITTPPPSPSSGPRIPRRKEWIELPEEYPGFKVLVWTNYPRRLNDELSSGDQDRMRAALLQIVLEHNNWCGEDGQPFPPANEAAFWDVIPDELAASVIVLLTLQVGKLATSLRTRPGR